MSAILSTNQDINNVTQLYDDIISSSNSYYFFVGGTTPWANNDTNVPTTMNTYQETEQSIYHDIVFGKQITKSNIAYLIPFIPWVTNTVFTQYDNLLGVNRTNYCVTGDYSVYKCIDNNANAVSTVQPALKSTTGSFQTSDGYTWKYMYTVPFQSNNFTTSSFIPVIANTIVANNSIPGTVDVIRVPVSGTNYQATTNGYVVYLSGWNTLIINAYASVVDNIYVGSSIYLKGGLGGDQIRLISAYNGATRQVTVSSPFASYVNLSFNPGSVSGSINLGDQVIQQINYVEYISKAGVLNPGDLLIQADTGAQGTIIHANDVMVSLTTGNVANPQFVLNYPLINLTYGPTAMTGTVSVYANSNVVYGANATNSLTANLLNYSIGNYIQVGGFTNNNVRLITGITNSSYITVNNNFINTLISNTNNKIISAFVPTSITDLSCNGIVVQTNLNSLKINYANLSTNSFSFIVGETVKEFDVNGIDQSANAIVSYVNSTVLILSSVQGTIIPGLFLTGQSSNLTAQTASIISYPNVTLANSIGNFVAGAQVYSTANNVVDGNANLNSFTYSPSSSTQYIISPTVTIEGDGNGAIAYSVVNTNSSSFGIVDVVVINPGQGYSNATAIITSNSSWGNGALLTPVVSPIYGHGSDPVRELGATYLGINITINNALNENYYFPSYGSYRRVGIIRNPLFYELWVNTAPNYHTMTNFNIQQIYFNYTPNEIAFQPSTNAAGVVVASNSTFLQLKTISGTFTSNAVNNAVNNMIIGLSSNATANVVSYSQVGFILNTNNQIISEMNTAANGYLTQVVSNTQIALTNVSGKFLSNTIVYDSSTNAYANVTGLLISNGVTDVTSYFGLRFNQTSRITINQSSIIPFQVGEYVNQETTNAYGMIISNTDEIDLNITINSGTFSPGLVISQPNTLANGIITWANSTYLKVTGVHGTFVNNFYVSCISGNASLNATYPVLLLADVQPNNPFETSYNLLITGNTSGATGFSGFANTITFPDLVRNSGEVLYISDLNPFYLSLTSKETFNLVIEM